MNTEQFEGHTPGDWRIESGREYKVVAANGQTIFLIGDDRRLIPTSPDGRLIAAAPELLRQRDALRKALKRLMDEIGDPENPLYSDMVFQARAALALCGGGDK